MRGAFTCLTLRRLYFMNLIRILALCLLSPLIGYGLLWYGALFPVVLTLIFMYWFIKPNRTNQ